MSKVYIPSNNVKTTTPIPSLNLGELGGLTEGLDPTIASNNNSNCEPIRFISDPKSKERTPPSSCCLGASCDPRPKEAKGGAWSSQRPHVLGTYDTVRLTSTGIEARDIIDPYAWQIAHGTALGDLLGGGSVPPISKRIFLDAEGNEVERGEHKATIGIDYIPLGGRVDEHRMADLTVVTIPSAPAMMYGDPTLPLAPEDVSRWMERVQTTLGNYIHGDVSTFNVSRLDSSTVYPMSEEVKVYIGLFNAITSAQQRKTNKKFYEGESVQFFNNSQSVGFYDKGAKEDHISILEDGTQLNLLRFELQKKKRQAVASTYGKLIASDLLREATMANAIKERAKAFDIFFPYNQKRTMQFSNNYNLFRLTKQENKRNHLDKYGKMLAVKAGLITLEEYDLFMRLEGYSPQYIARHNKAIREMQAQFVDVKDLYQEVKSAIEEDLKSVA